MILIKIGGSVISKKGAEEDLNLDAVREIGKILKGRNDLILVFGSGGVGHNIVRKSDLLNYDISKKGLLAKAYVDFDQAMLKVANVLVNEGVSVYVIHPKTLFEKSKKIDKDKMFAIAEYVRSIRFVPLFHPTIFVENDKTYLLSGDEIISALSEKAEKVIFLTDVDGLLDENKNIIPEIKKEDLSKIPITEKPGDVSGGMGLKLEETSKIRCPVYICNGYKPERLENILEGKETVCTKVI